MVNHRLVSSTSFQSFNLDPPFSNFQFVERQFSSLPAARRLFSLSRQFDGKTLVIEDIPAKGVIASENREIRRHFNDYEMVDLKRLSFWKVPFKRKSSLLFRPLNDLIGYALLKRDRIPSRNIDRWHVFESVFLNNPHEHNCVSANKLFSLRVGDFKFRISGIMFCQQNALNKACAQVGLRSLCSLHIRDTDLPYEHINQLAKDIQPFNPADGLNVQQMRGILTSLGVKFRDVDYEQSTEAREDLPYQKFLYSGIESGAGALLGFRLSGPSAGDRRHIIPFFGHTFSQDTWVPNAEIAYFHVGENTKYLPSDSWVGSFMGHDDNFGSNFSVPKRYVTPTQAEYVVEILNNGVNYSGTVAEAIGIDYLYSILPNLSKSQNVWLDRLINYSAAQMVVLRAISLTKSEFLKHIGSLRDWENNRENASMINILGKLVPDVMWMVELSLPELFPSNLRKLGEIILDASKSPATKRDFNAFVFARVPERYIFLQEIVNNAPSFLVAPSAIISHASFYRGNL